MQPNLLKFFFPFLFSFAITALIIPAWIRLCAKWKLFDKPDARKHHTATVPTMGGIAIFAGLIISFFLFSIFENSSSMQFVIAAAFILFLTGFFDDLTDIPAKRKLLIQFITALIVTAGGIKIETLNGLFGLHQIPLVAQYALTTFLILFITNAYNFIDGIDGLAAMLGLIALSVFAMLFAITGQQNFFILCICCIGALVAFICFNFDPAKIFMGDTGSLVIGFIISVCSVKLFTLFNPFASGTLQMMPQLITGALFVLIFDLTRVVFIRVYSGTSPFKADRSHLHHMVCRQEFGHRGASVILSLFSMFFILMSFVLKSFTPEIFIISCFCLAILLLNSKVISVFAAIRNKMAGVSKKKLGVDY